MIRFEDGYLSGSIEWTADALFRPTLAIFSGDSLAAVVPTTRAVGRSASGEPVWRCHVEPRRIETKGRARQLVTCLETGEVLFRQAEGKIGNDRSTPSNVATLIDRTRTERHPFRGTGFPSFLLLPLVDQLSILGKDLLEEDLDEDAQRGIESRIVAGETTILDIRDDLLGSERFRQVRHRSVDEYVGRWLVWDGLSLVGPRVLRPSPLAQGRENLRDEIRLICYLARSRPEEETAFHLAKIALGGQAPRSTQADWICHHAETIEQILRFRERSLPKAAGPAPASRKGLTFQNLNSMLTAGSAGRRRGAIIEGRGGTGGPLAFGPYMRLSPGTYRIRATVHASASNESIDRSGPLSPPASAVLSIEIAYRDAVLGYKNFGLDCPGLRALEVDFRIEPGWAHLLNDSLFEFRVSTSDGGRVALQALSLELLENAGSSATLIEWLPKMTFKPDRGPSGLLEKLRRRPHVICYGPYIRLMPGRYDLRFALAPGRSLGEVIATVKSEGRSVAQGLFPIGSEEKSVRLVFSVDDQASFDALPARFEFLLSVRGSTRVTVQSVTTPLLPSGDPDTDVPSTNQEHDR